MSLATFSRIFLWEIIGYFWYESLENKNTSKIMLLLFSLPNFKTVYTKFINFYLYFTQQHSILSKITPLKKPFVAKIKSKKKSKFKPKKNTT